MHKKMWIVAILFTGLFIASFTPFYTDHGAQTKSRKRELSIQKKVFSQIVTFHDYVKDSFFSDIRNGNIDTQRVRQAFLRSRLLFKEFEWAAAYFDSELTERLNGPPVQEVENADLQDSSLVRAIDPMGLQVIEPLIYPKYDTAGKKELIREVAHLIKNTEYLMAYFADHQLADWRILDAAKLEVFRIITLGITGFDNALSLNSMEESAASLKSLRKVLSYYTGKNRQTPLLQELDTAIRYLHVHPDFATFDRAVFITRFANKISTGIAQLEQNIPGPKIRYNRMLKQEAKTLFDPDAFNVDAFSPGPEFHITAAKVALGEKLFYDAALSGTGTRSCASCHRPELAFTDGLAKPTEIHDPAKLLKRNVPTLLNAALQSNYFYDMRALTLEEQVWDVISNKAEMDGSMEAIIKYVSADKTYQSLFAKAFPEGIPANTFSANTYSPDSFSPSTYPSKSFPEKTENSIRADEVTNALAAYIRSLTRLNSRFDEYMQGNEQALSTQELKGFNLFMGKAKCATCHFIPLFNGATPPKYVASETEVLGVPRSLTDTTPDPDRGYYDIIGVDAYKYAFKVPTVRNIDKTAPYMHNGVYQTLDQVMEFYNNGGGAGLGLNLPNQTLPDEKLRLTEKEKKEIIAFIRSLESKH
ncbi:cytochrome C peroxidase [Niabella ginsenosidivorans]|uniref:Cytochrome C peroxidase n=1 Tax=Niabella ginsenosidivorans TaxID=1176587 RepID=A0A1A9HZV6_9BACT|nr:cytochrome c peroxidase [Niabella ginsenosidivorans]ANH80906.1 cytochrome C peroxidase [Niabella ginsenosidivorans]